MRKRRKDPVDGVEELGHRLDRGVLSGLQPLEDLVGQLGGLGQRCPVLLRGPARGASLRLAGAFAAGALRGVLGWGMNVPPSEWRLPRKRP